MEQIRKKLVSILVHCSEGIEFMSRTELVEVIANDAKDALRMIELKEAKDMNDIIFC